MKKYVIKAYVESVLHILALKAFVVSLKIRKNVDLSGTIVIPSNSIKLGIQNDLDYFKSLNLNISVVNNCESLSFKAILPYVQNLIYLPWLFCNKNCLSNDGYFYLILPSVYSVKIKDLIDVQKVFGNNYDVVLLEEGIGSYIRTEKRWLNRGSEKLKGLRKQLKQLKTRITNYIRKTLPHEYLNKKHKLINFSLFTKINNELIPDNYVCRCFAETFKQNKVELLEKTDSYKNIILINSQPFFEQLSSNEDIECYQKLIRICKNLGCKVILKPHPREKYLERYKCLDLVMDYAYSNVAQEVLIANKLYKPIAVVGFFSTTLITANLFFGIPAISLGGLIDTSNLSNYGEDINKFIEVFNNIVLTPKCQEDLRIYLESQVRKNMYDD